MQKCGVLHSGGNYCIIVCLEYSLVKLFFFILYSMHLDVCCFCYHVSWQKKIIIRPNFNFSRLFKLLFLFQLFIILYFVVCMISCYQFVVK